MNITQQLWLGCSLAMAAIILGFSTAYMVKNNTPDYITDPVITPITQETQSVSFYPVPLSAEEVE